MKEVHKYSNNSIDGLFDLFDFVFWNNLPDFTDIVCIEKLFFNRKNMVFEKICMSKGVALELFCEERIVEVEPKKAKKEILGSGNVTKQDVKDTLGILMKIDFSKYLDDEVDAIYLALYAGKLLSMEKLYNNK